MHFSLFLKIAKSGVSTYYYYYYFCSQWTICREVAKVAKQVQQWVTHLFLMFLLL